MRSLPLAIGLLTVIPVRPVEPDERAAARAMLLAPVAGLLAAMPGALIVIVLDRPAFVVALLAVGSLAAMTGGLHWDGLADTADGLAVPAERQDRLAVMRRADLGPIGALVVALTALLQVAALAALIADDAAASGWLLTVVVSRASLALVCIRGTPPARARGLGALVIGCVPRWSAAALLIILGAGGVLAMPNTPRAVSAMVAGFGMALAVRQLAVGRLGGLSGDVLGAIVELSATACLIGLVIET